MRAATRVTITVAAVGLVASPALRDRDSFPLSTYPVYADARPAEATFVRAIGLDTGGDEIGLPMSAQASTDDPLVAQERLNDGVRSGRQEELCTRIMARAAGAVDRVLVVRERHDLVRAARGRESLLEREVLARCGRED